MYNITLDFAALGILLMILLVYNTLYTNVEANSKKFNIFLCSLLGTCIFDIASAYTITNAQTIPMILNNMASCLFFLFSGLTGFTLVVFLLSKMYHGTYMQSVMDINVSIFIVYAFLCISSPFTKTIFYFDNYVYCTGPLHGSLYFILGLFFIESSYIIYRDKEDLGKRQFFLQYLMLVLTVLGVLLQFFFPSVLISVFLASLSTIVWLLLVAAPNYQKLYESSKKLESYQTELELAHKKLTSRSNSMQELTKTASWALYFDKNKNITESTWSPNFLDMLSYNEDDAKSINMQLIWEESLHPDDKDAATQSFLNGMLSQSIYDINFRLRNKYGRYKWYRGTGSVTRDEDGDISVYQGIIQDINEEYEKDQLAKEKLAVLEELEKSQIALKKALLDAEKANLSKSRFLSSMSHDIRTPMNAIVGFTDLAIDNLDDKECVMDYLKKIQSSGSHLLSLINDILDMNKIESGNVSIQPTKQNIREFFNNQAQLLQTSMDEKNLHFSMDLTEIENENVKVDRLRLAQVIINCLGNSIKFTPPGGSISVDVREIPTKIMKKSKYQFIIKDTGIGMSKQFLAHIFEPFSREQTSTISQIQGTGLGMAISKSLIDMMEGTFNISSEINKGTTYIITIPLEICTPDETQPIANLDMESHTVDKIIRSLSGMRFLLVDDNNVNRVLAKAVLNGKNITIDEATNGEEAVNKITSSPEHTYDLILMDIQMPVMDGYEATKKIRALSNPVLATIPILAMTADAFEDDKKKCLECGMNGHLAKPFKVNDLIYALSDVLGVD